MTLVESQLPVHSHTTRAASGSASTQSPAGAVPATGSTPLYNSAPTTDQVLDPRAPAPHNNMQPSLVLRYCIAVQGIFPPRW